MQIIQIVFPNIGCYILIFLILVPLTFKIINYRIKTEELNLFINSHQRLIEDIKKKMYTVTKNESHQRLHVI